MSSSNATRSPSFKRDRSPFTRASASSRSQGGAEEAYAPEAVTAPRALAPDGAEIAVAAAPVGGSVRLRGADEAAVLTATFAGGWWTEDASGEWHNAAPEGFQGFRSAGEHFDYPVTIVTAPAALGRSLGNRLEIVPLVDPTALEVGAELPVQVLFDGQPLEGAEVAHDVSPPGRRRP